MEFEKEVVEGKSKSGNTYIVISLCEKVDRFKRHWIAALLGSDLEREALYGMYISTGDFVSRLSLTESMAKMCRLNCISLEDE